jgi:aerobic C4-dicarboxylate transport protein
VLIAFFAGFSIFRFIAYIKHELLIAWHQLVRDRAAAHDRQDGAPRRVEVRGRPRHPDRLQLQPRRHQHQHDPGDALPRPGHQLGILAIAMLTSKDASGVAGAGFVTLAATFAVVPTIPIASLALLVGIDKLMSECRALTNLIGNGVACVVSSRWEGELDAKALHDTMAHPIRVGEEMERLPA